MDRSADHRQNWWRHFRVTVFKYADLRLFSVNLALIFVFRSDEVTESIVMCFTSLDQHSRTRWSMNGTWRQIYIYRPVICTSTCFVFNAVWALTSGGDTLVLYRLEKFFLQFFLYRCRPIDHSAGYHQTSQTVTCFGDAAKEITSCRRIQI